MTEAHEFWQALTKKTFWNMEQSHRDGAIKGLTLAYLGTKTTSDDEEQSVRTMFNTMIDEYSRRAAWML